MSVDAAGRDLLGLLGVVDADAVAGRAAQQAIDGRVPQFAGDVPQGHVDAGQGVDHERATANVAVGAEDLLPEMFRTRGVLAVYEVEQRLGQGLRYARVNSLDLAPAGDAVVRLDLEEDRRASPVGLHLRDLDRGRAVLDGGGFSGVGEQRGA